MATITPNKTPSQVVISHQAVTHPNTVKAVIDVTSILRATFFLFHSPIETNAETNPPPYWQICSRPEAGNSAINENWGRAEIIPCVGGTPVTQALTASESIGDTAINVAATANFAPGDIIYVRDANTLTDSEWAVVQSIVTNTSVNLMRGLTRAKDNADFLHTKASVQVATIDCEGVESLELSFFHQLTTNGNDAHIKALMSTLDSYNAA